MEFVNLLRAQALLELSQDFLHTLIHTQLGMVDMPLKLLRFSLGRLHGGELSKFELGQNRLSLALKFASKPALELSLQMLGYQSEDQVLSLRVDHLHLSGFAGSPVLNLIPGKVLETVAAQANRRVPGLLSVQKNMELELHLQPILEKALREAPLRQIFSEKLGLEVSPEMRVQSLEWLEDKMKVGLEGQV